MHRAGVFWHRKIDWVSRRLPRIQGGSEMEGTVSTEQLRTKIDRKDAIKLVETLAPERYREAHLPGAMNIPPEQIKQLAPRLLPNKNDEIITYCTSAH
jgi:rhodanese-related sulfurtransferase